MVMFESNSIKMDDGSELNLDAMASRLIEQPFLRMQVVAHTDSKGSKQYNQNLSERRAKEVRRYLLAKGVKRRQLLIFGAGESDPLPVIKRLRVVPKIVVLNLNLFNSFNLS